MYTYTELLMIEWEGKPTPATIKYTGGDGFLAVTCKVADYYGYVREPFRELFKDEVDVFNIAKEYGLANEAIAEARISHYRNVVNPVF